MLSDMQQVTLTRKDLDLIEACLKFSQGQVENEASKDRLKQLRRELGKQRYLDSRPTPIRLQVFEYGNKAPIHPPAPKLRVV